VPAKVAGTWKMPEGELTLTQEFQMVRGMLRKGGESVPVSQGRLRGAAITFTIGGTTYVGNVGATTMEGTTSGGRAPGTWHAVRAVR